MTRYVALLRAVNVGGTGSLRMDDLKAICHAAGFASVQTYIASGNVVFDSDTSETTVKAQLEKGLLKHLGKPVGVVVRTAAELARVLAANPFKKTQANHTVAIFLDKSPPADAAKTATGQADEEIRLGRREIFVHYPRGQGRSKLKILAAKDGTARNMNTVAKLVALASRP
jgi:uncharacterized protein (DUF1697 family)